jgi:hypothetical protein
MRIYRGFHHPQLASACALTIGNFDGVHRGHQAMLALLNNEARHRGVPSCVMTFEPHPRDFFAAQLRKPDIAPARIATLRDKLLELAECGVDQCIVLPFNQTFASLAPQTFIEDVLRKGLGVKYVLVGDDFRFGAKRAGDYAMLDSAGAARGFDVARMNSYEVRGLRVSSSAVRDALLPRRHGKKSRNCWDVPTLFRAMWCMGANWDVRTQLPHPQFALHPLEACGQWHLRGAGAWPRRSATARRGQSRHSTFPGPQRCQRGYGCCWKPIA